MTRIPASRFIMDDVGIDQIKVFGYGGATPPRTPNMDTISKAGARFRNTLRGHHTPDPEEAGLRKWAFRQVSSLRDGEQSLRQSGGHCLGLGLLRGLPAGAPFPIDTTADGVAKPNAQGVGPYSCGFVPNVSDDPQNGVDTGACYVDGGSSCTQVDRGPDIPTPGRACLDRGGIFVLKQSCQP
jgi:hypothetical protein